MLFVWLVRFFMRRLLKQPSSLDHTYNCKYPMLSVYADPRTYFPNTIKSNWFYQRLHHRQPHTLRVLRFCYFLKFTEILLQNYQLIRCSVCMHCRTVTVHQPNLFRFLLFFRNFFSSVELFFEQLDVPVFLN